MTAKRGRTQAVRAKVFLMVMLMIHGQVAGQSYWTQRAHEVAVARLDAAQGTKSPVRTRLAHKGSAGSDEVLRGGPVSRQATELPVFRLAAGPESAPAGETLSAEERPPAESEEVVIGQEPAVARGPLPGFFETVKRDLQEAPGLLWKDTKAVYGNPWNLVFLVGAGGASIALRPEADDDIEDHYRKHHTFGQDQRDTVDVLGNPATAFAVAGLMYVAGQSMQEVKTYEVGKRAFSALSITGVSTLLLKLAANTESPNGENFAFPSGHMSSTMALATVLNDAYGPLVGVPMYGLTALVGIQRLENREHHLSDVVFGAALGWVVAETVMKEHRPEIFGGELVPYIDPNRATAGVAWIKPLGN